MHVVAPAAKLAEDAGIHVGVCTGIELRIHYALHGLKHRYPIMLGGWTMSTKCVISYWSLPLYS